MLPVLFGVRGRTVMGLLQRARALGCWRHKSHSQRHATAADHGGSQEGARLCNAGGLSGHPHGSIEGGMYAPTPPPPAQARPCLCTMVPCYSHFLGLPIANFVVSNIKCQANPRPSHARTLSHALHRGVWPASASEWHIKSARPGAGVLGADLSARDGASRSVSALGISPKCCPAGRRREGS